VRSVVSVYTSTEYPTICASSRWRLLALSGWGYTDFHASVNFRFTEFSEVRADTLAPWFACEGSNPLETSQARADTVGLPGVASGNCTPCGIRSIGNPDAASILPVQLKNEMSAVAS
jgi:hypothetical protein